MACASRNEAIPTRYRRFPIPVFDINSSVNRVLDHRSVRVEIVGDVDVNKRKCLEKDVPRQRNNLWGNNNCWKFVVCKGVVGSSRLWLLSSSSSSSSNTVVVVVVVVVVAVKSSS